MDKFIFQQFFLFLRHFSNPSPTLSNREDLIKFITNLKKKFRRIEIIPIIIDFIYNIAISTNSY